MRILTIPHTLERRRELFAWIGEACASAVVRNALGAPITSALGEDTWLLAIDGDELLGFCAVQMLKSRKAAKLHAFYTYLRNGKDDDALRDTAARFAAGAGATEISITDHAANADAYSRQGWEVQGARGNQYAVFRKALAA